MTINVRKMNLATTVQDSQHLVDPEVLNFILDKAVERVLQVMGDEQRATEERKLRHSVSGNHDRA